MAAGAAHRRATRTRRRPRDLRAARLRQASRPGPSSRWTGCSARAATPTRRSTASPDWPLAGPTSAATARDQLGLHFDLTVPFARYVLENAGKLTFPFRRYQIQKVWRGERPQEGRFREFIQADIDIIDAGDSAVPLRGRDARWSSPTPSHGCPMGPFRIQVNNRKIPEGFYLGLGLRRRGDRRACCASSTSSTRSAPRRCTRCSCESGAHAGAGPRPAWRWRTISAPDASFVDRGARARASPTPCWRRAWTELAAVVDAAAEHAPGLLVADLKIARGLDYYTGTVYETQLVGQESYGSVCSGGRYDALASDGKHDLPGGRHLDRRLAPGRQAAAGCSPRLARRRPPCSSALAAETDRAEAMRVAAALRSPRDPLRGGAGRGEVRQADPIRRPTGDPVRLVPGVDRRRRRRQPTPSRTFEAESRSRPTRASGPRRRTTCAPGSSTRTDPIPAG